MARQKVLGQVFGWRSAVIFAVGAFVAAVVGAILAVTKVDFLLLVSASLAILPLSTSTLALVFG